MLTHALTNFEIQKYYQNGPRFKMLLQKIMYLKKKKDGAYAINLDDFESIRSHWIALYMNGNNIIYFDSYEKIFKNLRN